VLFFSNGRALRVSSDGNATYSWRETCAEDTRNSSQIFARNADGQSGIDKYCANRRFLARADFYE
jgi:hypothetical protein